VSFNFDKDFERCKCEEMSICVADLNNTLAEEGKKARKRNKEGRNKARFGRKKVG
jgi:hypothetical protein